MRDGAQSLLRIIDDVLDFSKIEAGRLELESHRVLAVRPDRRRRDARFRGRPTSKGLMLHGVRSSRSSDDTLIGDPTRVRPDPVQPARQRDQVHREGRASPSMSGTSPLGGGRTRVLLTVSDTGIGIDDETRRRLFSAVRAGRTRRPRGASAAPAWASRSPGDWSMRWTARSRSTAKRAAVRGSRSRCRPAIPRHSPHRRCCDSTVCAASWPVASAITPTWHACWRTRVPGCIRSARAPRHLPRPGSRQPNQDRRSSSPATARRPVTTTPVPPLPRWPATRSAATASWLLVRNGRGTVDQALHRVRS